MMIEQRIEIINHINKFLDSILQAISATIQFLGERIKQIQDLIR